ncbi:MAG: leucine-rich repeat domain-containing protein [Clostridia bacterium]|nr:leucine-rich repeat domain-containing protein [Clostridia bacterium]
MKKILVSLLSACLLAATAIGLTACGGCQHIFTEEYVVQEATCTSAALHGYKCVKCGEADELNEPFSYGQPLGHDYAEYEVSTYPMFGKGAAQSTCSRCPSVDNKELPAIGGSAYTSETVDEHTVRYTVSVGENASVSFEVPTDYTYEAIMEEGEIVGVSAVGRKSSIKDVVIPSTYMGWKVLSVGNGKSNFQGFKGCQTVVLPEGITEISSYAFYECQGLREITLPTTLKVVGEEAFYDCRSLLKVNVSDLAAYCSVEMKNSAASPYYYASYFASTAPYLYVDGSAITDLVIPEGVKTIGSNVFYACEGLTSLTIASTVENIGDSAFQKTLLTQVDIPASVKSIGAWAFADTETLTSVSLHNGLQSIGRYAFELSGITAIELPDSLTDIGEYAFRRSALTEIVVPGGVKTLCEGTFSGCEQLGSVVLSNGVETVGKNVFENCKAMQSLWVGNTLKTVENQAFGFVAEFNLKQLHIADLASWCKADIIGYIPVYNTSTEIYLGNELLTEVEIPQDITEIKDNTFRGWNNLDTLTISSNITSIGEFAFAGSTLKEIVLPEGLTAIADYTFDNCRALTKVAMPDSVVSIGMHAFNYCSSLTEIFLPKGLESLGVSAFNGCGSLVNAYYEGSMQEWEQLIEKSVDLSASQLCYYTETMPGDVLNKYWLYNEQNVPTLWTYETTLEGKTYSYLSTETTVYEEYWTLLKQMEQQGMLEYMFEDTQQVEMITSSATKEEYAEKLEKFSASIFTDLKVSFADGKVTGTEAGEVAFTMDYVEYDGVVYYVVDGNIQLETPAFYIDAQTNTIFEYTESTIEVGNTTYKTTNVKHSYQIAA